MSLPPRLHAGFAAVALACLPAAAKPAFVRRAQSLGFSDITSCQACHATDHPRKGDPQHNARGKWLMAEKSRRHADEVDLAWLKDYPGARPAGQH